VFEAMPSFARRASIIMQVYSGVKWKLRIVSLSCHSVGAFLRSSSFLRSLCGALSVHSYSCAE